MTRALSTRSQLAAVGFDGDAVRHAADEADEDGEAVAGGAEEFQALVGQPEDVGDEADADDVERIVADGPAGFLGVELDQVGLAAAAGEDGLEGLLGRLDAEIAEEGVAGPGRDLADLGEAGGAAVGVEAVDDLVGRAVAAEAEDAVVGAAGRLAAEVDRVPGVFREADLEAGELGAEARFEPGECLAAEAVAGGGVDDEQCFHGFVARDL